MPNLSICRLCVNSCSDFKNLYNPSNGRPNQLCEIMIEYFHPKIIDKEMAKNLSIICLECFRHIDDFHNFQACVLVAQSKLMVSIKTDMDEVQERRELPDEIVRRVKEEPQEGVPLTGALQRSAFEDINGFANVTTLMGDKGMVMVHGPSDIPHTTNDEAEGALVNDNASMSGQNNVIPNAATTPQDKGTRQGPIENGTIVGADSEVKLDGDLSHMMNTVTNKKKSETNNGNLMANNKGRKRYQCKLCSHSFAYKNFLNLHINNQHIEKRMIANRKSRRSFDGTSQATTVFEAIKSTRHTVVGNHAFPVPKTDKVLKEGMSLVHGQSDIANMSYDETKDALANGTVSNDVGDATGYSQHMAENNSSTNDVEERYQCKLCSHSSVFKRVLNLHMYQKHNKRRMIANKKARRYTIAASPVSTVPKTDEISSNGAAEDNFTSSTVESVKKQFLNDVNCQAGDKTLRQPTDQHHNLSGETSPADDNALSENKCPTNGFKCTICDISFSSLFILRTHLTKYHSDIVPSMLEADYDPTTKRYNCKFCGNYFIRKFDLMFHVDKWHKNNEDTSNISSLNGSEHNDTKKKFPCNFCVCSYGYKTGLQLHMRMKHPEKYRPRKSDLFETCTICGNLYAHKWHYINHMESNHPEYRTEREPAETILHPMKPYLMRHSSARRTTSP